MSAETRKLNRVGLFGGSFNPVHLGHLLVAQAAREELELDRLFFLPAAQSPFKPGVEALDGGLRARLLRLALAGWEWCEVDEQELKRGGVSYTIETVRDFAERFPATRLYYLIGSDHVPNLPKWRSADELARFLDFVVIPRPGEAECAFPPPFKGVRLRGFPLGLSASQIRARIVEGKPIDHLVGPNVGEAIRKNHLYL